LGVLKNCFDLGDRQGILYKKVPQCAADVWSDSGWCWAAGCPLSDPRREGWESWGCSAWRREGFRETLEQLPAPGGAARELERGWDKGMGRQDKGRWLQAGRGEIQIRYKERILYCEGGEALGLPREVGDEHSRPGWTGL